MRISDWSSDVCSSDLVDAEKHDAQKAGLQKEGGQYFVCHKRSDYRAGPIGKDRPVRAELIGHDNARDDTHAKDNGKYLQPIAKEIGINRSEEHTSEIQSLMSISYDVYYLITKQIIQKQKHAEQ